MRAKKFSLKKWPRMSWLTQWAISNCLTFFVMSWQGGFKDFGKDKKVIQIKWLSWVGTKCLLQRRKELWVFMTWKHLISLSKLNKDGGSKTTQTRYFIQFLNTNTFQMVTFLRSCIGVLDLRPHWCHNAHERCCIGALNLRPRWSHNAYEPRHQLLELYTYIN